MLHHAIHLATMTLSLHNPSVPIDRYHLIVLKLGVEDNKNYLGSINLLESNEINKDMVLSPLEVRKEGMVVSLKESKPEPMTLPSFHICIMNPPFTRSVGGNLLFGSLPKKKGKCFRASMAPS